MERFNRIIRFGGPLLQTALLIASVWKLAACSEVTIVGGHEVKPHSRPWMVSLQVKNNHVCGGTLIRDQWVLTAAHCKGVFGESKKFVEAVLGAHSLTSSKNTQRVGIEEYYVPGTYSDRTKEDDIMLIKLKMKVKINSKAVKVKEVSKSGKDLQVGTQCHVTGWGVVSATGSMPSDTLQGAEVDILDRKLCDCFYNRNPVITQDMLCASNNKRQADACKGDSGGPLECKKAFVGLVSGGLGCGNPKKPGVYTRFSKRHLDWIHKIIKHQSNTTNVGIL
eukprot:XP_013988768.1 PREDICTED: granzyme K-like [Salmo salar]